jgi:hypothetical protein
MESPFHIRWLAGLRERMAGVPLLGSSALLLLPLLLALRLATGGSVSAQGPDWPTPPPGPAFPIPSEQALGATVSTTVASPGGQVMVVPVSWPGSLPLIPPLPSTNVTFDDPSTGSFTLRIDAGTFAETVQLKFAPAEPAVLPRTGSVLAAFELTAFDVAGSSLPGTLSRPIRLSMQTGPWSAAGVDPMGVLGALVEGEQIRLIATEFDLNDQRITLRLVALGTVFIIAETPFAPDA